MLLLSSNQLQQFSSSATFLANKTDIGKKENIPVHSPRNTWVLHGSAESVRTYGSHLRKSVYKEDPLFRCGLVVSGANNFGTDIEQDGYLMGYELANTDLRNCQLISLSACETGLGDVRNNLGVDGLPRALKLGGARYLLISLWKVPDVPTAGFMKEFYTRIFAGDSPILALQKTQEAMSKRFPVSAWAAFILVD